MKRKWFYLIALLAGISISFREKYIEQEIIYGYVSSENLTGNIIRYHIIDINNLTEGIDYICDAGAYKPCKIAISYSRVTNFKILEKWPYQYYIDISNDISNVYFLGDIGQCSLLY